MQGAVVEVLKTRLQHSPGSETTLLTMEWQSYVFIVGLLWDRAISASDGVLRLIFDKN